MEMIEYKPNEEESRSLKHQLVSAVAAGDEAAAEELRMLLKLIPSERLPGEARAA